MAAEAAEIWRQFFAHWPDEVPHRGVLVTPFGEQIAFESFATSSDLLLIERRAPDTVGARIVVIAYQQIQAVKIVDVVKAKAFAPLGFVTASAKK